MASHNPVEWHSSDPRRDDAVRVLIREGLGKINDLAEQLHDDELMALVLRLERFREIDLTPSNLQRTAEDLADKRMREAPEPAGADWACESPDRAAAVVDACRLVHKRMTGPHSTKHMQHYLRFAWKLEVLTHARVNQFTLRAWRRRDTPVDRDIVGAALKLAHVENARELTLSHER